MTRGHRTFLRLGCCAPFVVDDLHPWLSFDADAVQRIITQFLSTYLDQANAKGYVIGLSGGLDSSLTAALAVDALGPGKIQAFTMPGPTSTEDDGALAQHLADDLDLSLKTAPIGPATDALLEGFENPTREIKGNIQARLRMTLLYAHAQKTHRLVLGTGNKSELLTGYFTKHGDGGADLLPLGDVYKTQTRHIARQMRIPQPILDRPPTAGLWSDQTDEDDLGYPYDTLDVILSGIEQQHPTPKIANEAHVDETDIQRVRRLIDQTQHKRNPPPTPKIGWRTPGVDWREPTQP